MVEREDGVLEWRAALPIPADQRWFWEKRWQEREREVDEHIDAGALLDMSPPKSSWAISTVSTTGEVRDDASLRP